MAPAEVALCVTTTSVMFVLAVQLEQQLCTPSPVTGRDCPSARRRGSRAAPA
jgi:hypothetical protein